MRQLSSLNTPLAAPQCRSDVVRRRILDSARNFLAGHDNRQLSIEAVAAHAGLTRRTIYNRFASRDDLYRASRLELLGSVESALPTSINENMPFREAMEFFAAHVLEVMTSREHQEFWRSMRRDGVDHPWLRSEYDRRIMRPLELLVDHQMLLRGRRGEILPSDSAPSARSFLTTLIAATSLEHEWSYTSTLTAAELSILYLSRIGAAAA